MTNPSENGVLVFIFSLMVVCMVNPVSLRSADTVHRVRVDSVDELRSVYRRLDGSSPSYREQEYVLLQSLPEDFGEIQSVDRKKRLFERILLPLIFYENDRIRHRRRRIRRLREQFTSDTDSLLPGQRRRIRTWMLDYNLVEDTPVERLRAVYFSRLLHRVQRVPPSLVLAQAASESGWGASRFARRANNLFGERTYDPNTPGIKPRGVADTADFRIQVFDSLQESVRSYLHTLNSHWAYEKFRRLRDRHPPGQSLKLVEGLTRYSERRDRYINLLVSLIKYNGYRRYDRGNP